MEIEILQALLFIVIILPVIFLIIFGYKKILKNIENKRLEIESKLNSPDHREETIKEINRKIDRSIKILHFLIIYKIVAGLLFVVLGGYGIYALYTKIIAENFNQIFNEYNYTYYFASPVLFVIGIIMIFSNAKKLINNKKINE